MLLCFCITIALFPNKDYSSLEQDSSGFVEAPSIPLVIERFLETHNAAFFDASHKDSSACLP